MKPRFRVEIFVFLAIGGLFVATGVGLPNPDESIRLSILKQLLVYFGLVSGGIGGIGTGLLVTGRPSVVHHLVRLVTGAVAELFLLYQAACRQFANRSVWLSVLIITLLAGVGRALFLDAPIKYDEAYTLYNYVDSGVAELVHYSAPNNHMFHSFLVKVSFVLFGGGEAAIRIPSYVCGLLTIPLAAIAAAHLHRSNGVLAAAIMGVYPYLVYYGVLARGYTILLVFTLLLLILLTRFVESPSSGLYLPIAVVISGGLFTMPSFAFPTVGLFAWMLVARAVRGHSLVQLVTHVSIPCVALSVLITSVLYAPVLLISDGIDAITNNRFVASVPLPEFFAAMPQHICDTFAILLIDISPSISILFLGGLIAGVGSCVKSRNWAPVLLLPVVLAGSIVLLVVKHAVPFPRTWIYLLPLAIVLVDAVGGWLPKSARAAVFGIAILLAGGGTFGFLQSKSPAAFEGAGACPGAEEAANFLQQVMQPEDRYEVDCPADEPLRYYMRRSESTAPASAGPTPYTYYVIHPDFYQVTDLTKAPNPEKVAAFEDAIIYRVPRVLTE